MGEGAQSRYRSRYTNLISEDFFQSTSFFSFLILIGDICCLTRGSTPLSCDMVLLTGSCIVNEAMLTGESTPLIKVFHPFIYAFSYFLPYS